MAERKLRFWARPSELRERGILGLNARNGDYVLAANPRQHYPRVDDKLRTKRICENAGIPVPETFAAIERHGDIRRLGELVRGRPEFVIKPARGSEGRGIIVIVEHDGETYRAAGGQRYQLADLRYHASTVVSGFYSLAEQPDAAIIEQRIVRHPAFENLALDGTPDVRVVVYRGVPAMAMVRLPTRASRGRANLHQGAIAAAVGLRDGCTHGGVCGNRTVSRHPDTGASIEGMRIPFWKELLTAAMKLSDTLELGYVGIDFVLDAAVGPVVLEANARPGLAIQIANRHGLTPRLQWIDRAVRAGMSLDERRSLVTQIAAIRDSVAGV